MFGLLILFWFFQIRNLMFFLGCIIVVFIHGLPITSSAEVDLFPESDVFQVARPAAGRFHFKHKTIVFYIIEAFASHTEVRDEFAVIESEVVSRARTVGSKIENASVCAANRDWCVSVPVKELG